jgi:type IV secretion system protein VirD4
MWRGFSRETAAWWPWKGKTAPEFVKTRANTAPVGVADAVAGFPRGLPDNDPYKPAATGRWPSAAELSAKLETWRPGLFLIGRDHTHRYVGHGDDRHVLTCSGSRSGKGVSLITPNLLYWPGSVIAIDPKGELATLTASRRSKNGSHWSQPMHPGEGEVFVLDPFERVTGPAKQYRAAFNPLADLDPETDAGLDMAGQIADALIIQSQGDGSYWTQSARTFLRGLILYVATGAEPASRTLIRVRELVTQETLSFNATLDAMKKKGGVMAGAANAMQNRPDNERMSVLSTCEAQTAFLEGEAMRRVLSGSDFRLEDLKARRVTVYLCLPALRLATHGRWLRLFIALALEAMERTGPVAEDKPRVLFVLDEFSTLGHMEVGAAYMASFGVKLWPIIQDVTQLQRHYREEWETFMGNAGLLTFFGNTDVTTTEHIVKRLGQVEVMRRVKNYAMSSSGPGMLERMLRQGGMQYTAGESDNESVMHGPLMSPSEIASHFARDARNILASIAREKLPPFALYRCFYHSDEDDELFGGLFDPVPGQKEPKTTAGQRKERDKAGLWRVPVW